MKSAALSACVPLSRIEKSACVRAAGVGLDQRVAACGGYGAHLPPPPAAVKWPLPMKLKVSWLPPSTASIADRSILSPVLKSVITSRWAPSDAAVADGQILEHVVARAAGQDVPAEPAGQRIVASAANDVHCRDRCR